MKYIVFKYVDTEHFSEEEDEKYTKKIILKSDALTWTTLLNDFRSFLLAIGFYLSDTKFIGVTEEELDALDEIRNDKEDVDDFV